MTTADLTVLKELEAKVADAAELRSRGEMVNRNIVWTDLYVFKQELVRHAKELIAAAEEKNIYDVTYPCVKEANARLRSLLAKAAGAMERTKRMNSQHGTPCWCSTAAGIYCVGQKQCRQAAAVLAEIKKELG